MTPNPITHIPHIETRPNSEYLYIIGKNITVEYLSTLLHKPEWSVEKICKTFDITPADVYAAWSVYYTYKEQVDNRVMLALNPKVERD